MPIYTFERYEKKFLLSAEKAKTLERRLASERGAVYDKYCPSGETYGIYNIYFDDSESSVINASLKRPRFKEKLRLRGYSFPKTGEETVFLEIKRKINGIVTKRRATLPYSAAMDFATGGPMPETDDYSKRLTLSEIDYFLKHRRPLEPKVFISYDRVAMADRDDPTLRITFDENILTRRYDVDLAKGAGGEPLLGEGERLMEIKFIHALPKWLCDMLAEEEVYMTRFSKYGNEYSRLRGHEFNHIRKDC